VIELAVAGARWLLGHPGWALGLAAWAVAVALIVLGSLVLARGVVWGLVGAAAGTLAWRILRGDVAAPRTRKGTDRRGRHSPLYARHVTGQSPAWRALRSRVLARAGGRCEGCGRFASALAAHHLTYARLGRERLSDLVGLCQPCHDRAHAGRRNGHRGAAGGIPAKKYRPAKRGRAGG
jgi:5-methylcytosine-specific restriction endonuclease McrA